MAARNEYAAGLLAWEGGSGPNLEAMMRACDDAEALLRAEVS